VSTIFIETLSNITVGEEITINYTNLQFIDIKKRTKCTCGSPRRTCTVIFMYKERGYERLIRYYAKFFNNAWRLCDNTCLEAMRKARGDALDVIAVAELNPGDLIRENSSMELDQTI